MKTKYITIVNHPDHESFVVNSKVYDIGRQAEIVQKIAREQIEQNGEFAKIHCSNIVEWMQDIADMAQKTLDIQLGKE